MYILCTAADAALLSAHPHSTERRTLAVRSLSTREQQIVCTCSKRPDTCSEPLHEPCCGMWQSGGNAGVCGGGTPCELLSRDDEVVVVARRK